jgi:hypothetical protein
MPNWHNHLQQLERRGERLLVVDVDLGFGRMAASEEAAPILVTNPV